MSLELFAIVVYLTFISKMTLREGLYLFVQERIERTLKSVGENEQGAATEIVHKTTGFFFQLGSSSERKVATHPCHPIQLRGFQQIAKGKRKN